MTSKKSLFRLLNNFFDHIYLITLKRSTDRHQLVEKNLDGLNYEIFHGIDGSKLNINKIQETGLYNSELSKRSIPYNRELTPGEIGCSLSHIEVYKDILDKNYQTALILEDDVVISTENSDKLSHSLAELPETWDLLYLGYFDNNEDITLPITFRIHIAYPILHKLGMEQYDARKLRCKYPRLYSEHLDLAGFHYGTHAYAVTSPGAEKILSYQTPVTMAPDNAIGMMCMEESIKALRVKTKVFNQNRDLPSTIRDRYEVTQ